MAHFMDVRCLIINVQSFCWRPSIQQDWLHDQHLKIGWINKPAAAFPHPWPRIWIFIRSLSTWSSLVLLSSARQGLAKCQRSAPCNKWRHKLQGTHMAAAQAVYITTYNNNITTTKNWGASHCVQKHIFSHRCGTQDNTCILFPASQDAWKSTTSNEQQTRKTAETAGKLQ